MNIHLQKNEGELPVGIAFYANVTPDPEDFQGAGIITLHVDGKLVWRAFHEWRLIELTSLLDLLKGVGVEVEVLKDSWRVSLVANSPAANMVTQL